MCHHGVSTVTIGTTVLADYGWSGNSSNASPNKSSATVDESKNPLNSEWSNERRRNNMARAEIVTPATTPNTIYFFMGSPDNNFPHRAVKDETTAHSRELTPGI